MADVAVRRWAGNGYGYGYFGLVNFNGLLLLEIQGSRLTVRVRPRFLGRVLGVVPLVAEPGSGLTVTMAKVPWGWGTYMKFELPDTPLYAYRATAGRKAEILSCLTAVGFEVATFTG